jgi:gliding-associated putative ABC transporter substrate-binding component GldG
MKRKTWSVTSISNLAVIIAIVVVINLIGLRLFTRVDLTEKKIYTLSPASRHTVANLADRLTVKAYFTKNLPAPYNANSRYISDVLQDYASYSHGKFVYEFVDPADEAKLEEEAQRYRIQPAQVNVMEKDNLQVKKVYMGLVLIYGDKHETIPIIQDVNGFEYDMTSTIKRLVADRIPKVGFLSGFGTPDPGNDMRNLSSELSKHYEVVPVSTQNGNSMIDSTIDVLCIVQPKEALDDWTKFCVDQYVMHGGKVGWFINKVKADPQTSQASALQLGIDDMTKAYGFDVANNLVTDAQASAITVQQPQGNVMMITQVRYAAFPRITNINRQNPMVKDLQELALFFPSSIDTMGTSGGKVNFIPLFESSQYTKVQMGRYDINPMAQIRREDFNGGQKLLGVAITGIFPSAFTGKPIPHPKDSTAAVPAVNIVTQSPTTRMVAIGDGNFVQGQYAQGGGPNQILFLNAVDWLSQDQDLMSIRSREATIRPLKENISDGTKQTVKYADLFAPPALVLILGLFRWTSKRNRRKGVTL